MCASVYTDAVQCSAVRCLCLWSTSALARYVHYVHTMRRSPVVYTKCWWARSWPWGWGQQVSYTFFLKTIKTLNTFFFSSCIFSNSCNHVPYINTTNLQSDIGTMGIFSEPLILAELRVQCTRSTVRDNVSQYAMQELLVSKFEQKMCNGRKAYW